MSQLSEERIDEIIADQMVSINPVDGQNLARAIEREAAKFWQVPEGWLRAVDEELVSAHLNVANTTDTYDEAKRKLSELISWHIAVATDPKVNGGYKLVPIEPTEAMVKAAEGAFFDWKYCSKRSGDFTQSDSYKAMIAAAPEMK